MPEIRTNNDLSPITRTEVEFTLKEMPMNKVPGPDNVYIEMIVATGESGLTELRNLSNKMYLLLLLFFSFA